MTSYLELFSLVLCDDLSPQGSASSSMHAHTDLTFDSCYDLMLFCDVLQRN